VGAAFAAANSNSCKRRVKAAWIMVAGVKGGRMAGWQDGGISDDALGCDKGLRDRCVEMRLKTQERLTMGGHWWLPSHPAALGGMT
jgi:hypothetical protein